MFNMLFNTKNILIKLSFFIVFSFLFQETIYAKEYSVNNCVVIFSDDWAEKKLNNNQSAQDKQYDQLFLINEERHEMAYIIAFPLSNGMADMSEIEKTESSRNTFVKQQADYLMEFSEYTNAEKILFSEYRYTNSFGTAYIEYIKRTEKSGRIIYARNYETINNSTLYTCSFLYALEDDFIRGDEYDKQIVNNIKFGKNPSASQKKCKKLVLGWTHLFMKIQRRP